MKRALSLNLIAIFTVIVTCTMAAPTNASSSTDQTVRLHGMYTQGSGDIIAVEYTDLECLFCKTFYHTMEKVMDKYSGKLVWGYKDFPLTTVHSRAKRESMASECAAEQNRLHPFIKNLFHTTTFSNNLTDHDLVSLANDVGIEPKQFRSCLKSRKYLTKINRDMAEGDRLGVTGTPTLLIVDNTGKILDRIVGAVSVDDVSAILDQYIN